MTQPQFVPVGKNDKVRPGDQYPVPDSWAQTRPAEIDGPNNPSGPLFGSVGPDQGYGLKLAKRFDDRLQLGEHEERADVISGCLGVALKRASIFGRAPVIYDFELAYTLWGFLGKAPAELVEYRRPLFEAASHHYEDQRHIADQVSEATLRMTPQQVAAKLSDWKSLLSVPE